MRECKSQSDRHERECRLGRLSSPQLHGRSQIRSANDEVPEDAYSHT